MKRLKKIIIITIVILVVIFVATYIDYFITKTNNTYPKISIKQKLSDNEFVYKAILYKVWYCDSNKTYTIGNYSDKDAICPKNYTYVDDFYTNESGIKISKRDLQLLTNDGVYSSEMVENMNTEKQVSEAVHVSEEYGKTKYKSLNKESEDGYKLVLVPKFKSDKNGNYKWQYDDNENEYYCLRSDKNKNYLSKYNGEECEGFNKVKMDSEWCTNYVNSMLVYEDNIEELCKE